MNRRKSPQSLGKILIIDDTPNNLRFLSNLLEKAGYSIHKVTNGQAGLEAAQLDPPDLILLDIKMPGLDGYQVCDQLKNSERTCQIPVIFLSAMDEEMDKVMAFEAGGIDYITKPFQMVEVLARIKTHLQLSRLRQELQQQNAQLQQEIAQRTAAESALEILNQGLEARIRDRMVELQAKCDGLMSLKSELQQALAQEQHLNRLKTQMMMTINQEVRLALTILSTAVELLKHSGREWSVEDGQHLQMIADSVDSIHKVFKGTLLSTDIDSEKPERILKPIDLHQFCQVLAAQWTASNVSNCQLAFVRWGKSRGLVLADETLLQQIFFHLLDNAMRYSPSGGTILIQLVYEPTQVVIQVRDEGMGIPNAELDRVWDSGYRASNANLIPGKGFGLAVVKQAVTQQDGSITLTSEIEKGTIVTLTLPIAPDF